MKKEYTIFYSWQNDTDGDREYVRGVLESAIETVSKDLDVKISIDSDSRDEDGETSIDAAIMTKIANCDFFVCDVTPVAQLYPQKDVCKAVPNPNVMLELGFAIGNIGWERCILVWNTKMGSQQNAPFDIRNHVTAGYELSKEMLSDEIQTKNLNLTEIIKGKIERFDEIIAKQQDNLVKKYDYKVYRHWLQIIPFDKLKNSIDFFCSNNAYFHESFEMWDRFQYQYDETCEYRFVDEELTIAIEDLVENIQRLVAFASTNCVQNEVMKNFHKLRSFYDFMDHDKALAEETKCVNIIDNLHKKITESLMNYRRLIACKFGE